MDGWPSTELMRADDESQNPTLHQFEAMHRATRDRLGFLTGGPGTGKTHVTSCFIKLLPVGELALAAPTGKAAVRMRQSLEARTGLKLMATTIHKLLGPEPRADGTFGFTFTRDNRLPFRYYIIDESSMIDTALMAALLEALPDDAYILFIGDPEQLPPVGRGRPFLDMLSRFPDNRGHLSEIHRFAGTIARVCDAIKKGEPWAGDDRIDLEAVPPKNFAHVECGSAQASIDMMLRILNSAKEKWGFDPMEDMQVLCAVNRKTPVSRQELNTILQSQFNPDGEKVGQSKWRIGDKAICLRNGYRKGAKPVQIDPSRSFTKVDGFGDANRDEDLEEKVYVANGEIGKLVGHEQGKLQFQFDDGRSIIVPMGQWDEFDLGYALTVHKSQGSQWKCIIVMIDDSNSADWVASRSYHYTGASRPGKVGFLVGRKNAFHRQCQKLDVHNRKTFLVEKISERLSA